MKTDENSTDKLSQAYRCAEVFNKFKKEFWDDTYRYRSNGDVREASFYFAKGAGLSVVEALAVSSCAYDFDRLSVEGKKNQRTILLEEQCKTS